jgi:HEAT repeat protein
MRLARAIFFVLFATAIAAHAAMTQLPDKVVDVLSAIDRAPTATDLDSVIGSGMAQPTADDLATIAADPNVDVGVALRSIRALSQYPVSAIGSSLAHDTLVSIIGAHQGTAKLDMLLLRAALESLGQLHVSADVPLIATALDHPSRDVRTTAARALRALGDPSAIPALRQRYGQEMIPQVRLAIESALAALGGA